MIEGLRLSVSGRVIHASLLARAQRCTSDPVARARALEDYENAANKLYAKECGAADIAAYHRALQRKELAYEADARHRRYMKMAGCVEQDETYMLTDSEMREVGLYDPE